jgi:hypothetical protein
MELIAKPEGIKGFCINDESAEGGIEAIFEVPDCFSPLWIT